MRAVAFDPEHKRPGFSRSTTARSTKNPSAVSRAATCSSKIESASRPVSVAIPSFPVCAKDRKILSAATPLPFERERSMSSPVIEEKTSQRSFAREISTFRRRSTAFRVQRTEAHRDEPFFRPPISERDENDVAFVTPGCSRGSLRKTVHWLPRPKKSSVSGCSRLRSSSSFWIA